jgi:hypothetical protein
MASIAPISSEFREVLIPRFEANAPKRDALEFLNKPPQAERPGLPNEAPSQLHLTQFKIGGCQTTSLILGALPEFILTLNC